MSDQTTHIRISKNAYKKLAYLKLDMDFKSFEQAIDWMIAELQIQKTRKTNGN